MTIPKKTITLILLFSFNKLSFGFGVDGYQNLDSTNNYNKEEFIAIQSYKFIKEAREHSSADNYRLNENHLMLDVITVIGAGAAVGHTFNLMVKDKLPSFIAKYSKYPSPILGAIGLFFIMGPALFTQTQNLADGTLGPNFLTSKEKLQAFFELEFDIAVEYIKASPTLQQAFDNLRIIYPGQNDMHECLGIDKDIYIQIINESLFDTYENFNNKQNENLETNHALNINAIKKYYELISAKCYAVQDKSTHFLGDEAFEIFNHELGKSIEDNKARMDELKKNFQSFQVIIE